MTDISSEPRPFTQVELHGNAAVPDQPAPNLEEARRAIERERETRHWPIAYFRDEFGEDWPRASAGIDAAADEAVDFLLSEREARGDPEPLAEFARFVLALDDPRAVELRRSITLTEIIGRAESALRDSLPATESAQAEPPDRNSGHSPEEVVEQPTSEAGS